MSDQLDVHPASEAERVEFYRQTYETWGKPGLSIEQHISNRMTSPQHRRATWFVGCVDGRQVCGLGSYPMRFRLQGRTIAGIAIGSVHTLADFRRHGYASQLLNQVEDYERRRGACLSLLYSDIDAAFYEKLGYGLCSCWEGWMDCGGAATLEGEVSHRLVPSSPVESRSLIQELYEQHHAALPVSIARNAAYWEYVFQKGAGDEFLILKDSAGSEAGYIQLGVKERAVTIRDWALADATAASIRGLLAATLLFARQRGRDCVGGWLPDHPESRALFDLSKRTRELTMLKPLTADVRLSAEALKAAQDFREIDHV